jgi:uncharacterized protein
MTPPDATLMEVTLVFAPKARVLVQASCCLPARSTVRQALEATGWWQQHWRGSAAHLSLGIWNRKATPETVLAHGDRIELYRPLTVDPKTARRERFAKQGVRTAGLFKSK